MRKIIIGVLITMSYMGWSQEQPIPDSTQIKMTSYIAPLKDRPNVKVLGYDQSGVIRVLRPNNKSSLTCVADDPTKEGLELVCYSSRLDDFMQRGRDLRIQGVEVSEIHETRKKEIENGMLKMPEGQGLLYLFYGDVKNLNKKTGEVKDGYMRYVIYTPYATEELSGLPLKPSAPGMPWLMAAGTHRAHIMINPPKNE
jgi:hypothetical protein